MQVSRQRKKMSAKRRSDQQAFTRNVKRKPTSIKLASASNRSLNARIRKIAMSVSETKTTSASSTNVALTNAAGNILFAWPNLGQGSDIISRIGNSVNLQKLKVDLIYNNTGTGSSNKVMIRELMLRVDAGRYQTNTQLLANLFEGQTDSGQTLTNQDMLRAMNTDGIHVMHDRVFSLHENNNQGSLGQTYHTVTRQMNNKQLLYRDTSSADPATDRYVFITLVVDPASAGTLNTVGVSANLRMWYKDP